MYRANYTVNGYSGSVHGDTAKDAYDSASDKCSHYLDRGANDCTIKVFDINGKPTDKEGFSLMQYKYRAMDCKGREVSGHVQAKSEMDANAILKDKGYFPISITSDSPTGNDAKVKKYAGIHINLRIVIFIMGFVAGLLIGVITTLMWTR